MRAAPIQMPPAGHESDVLPGLPAAETPAYWRAQREGVALVCELRHRIGIAWDAPTYGAGGSEHIAPWDHAFDELHAARRHPFAANLRVARSVTPTVAIVAALGAITAAAPVIAAGWGCRERDERGGGRAASPAPMTPDRFREVLALLDLPQRGFAHLLNRPEGTVHQWARSLVVIPADVAAWLEALAAFLATHPLPARAADATTHPTAA